MAFCRVVFSFLVLSVISGYASNVPVIIWGDFAGKSIESNPLAALSSEEFGGILNKKLVDDTVTIIFQEERLSVEDFSYRNEDGETSFPYLHGIIKKAIYIPSVESPLEELHLLAKGHEETTVSITEGELLDELPEKSDSGNFIFIDLADAKDGESRSKLLKRHDDYISEVVRQMKERYGNVVAIYTAEYPSWIIPEPPVTHSRSRRAASEHNEYRFDNLHLKFKNITLVSKNVSTPLSVITGSKTSFDGQNSTTEMEFENITLTLNFIRKGGYWFFGSVTLVNDTVTETLKPVGDEVFAIEGFSYRCAQYVRFASVNKTNSYYALNFENLKIQPFFEQTNNTDFGDSFNCVGFFTAPIWAGLFVVFILLSITFYGIMMMMDIRTMDRFDDPKGKTITINASE